MDAALLIPNHIRANILPSPDSSILELLRFKLPSLQTNTSSASTKAHELLSYELPGTSDTECIRDIAIPGTTLAGRLEEAYKKGSEKIKSVRVLHAGKVLHLPLWVITFWKEAAALLVNHRGPWLQAEKFLEARDRAWKDPSPLIREVYTALGGLPWSGQVNGFKNREPIAKLATYASTEWLSDVHEDQMVDLLRRDLRHHHSSERIELPGAFFQHYLLNAYRNQETYCTDEQHRFVRGLGQALANGIRGAVGFIAHVNGNHWIPIVADFMENKTMFGDSLDGDIDQELVEAVDWWTYEHTGSKFIVGSLVITQQKDTHSCGILAVNALAHHFAPELHPLIDAKKVDVARLQLLLQVIARHNDNSFETEAIDFSFTFKPAPAESDDDISVISSESSYRLSPSPHGPMPPSIHAPSPSSTPNLPPTSDDSDLELPKSVLGLRLSPLPSEKLSVIAPTITRKRATSAKGLAPTPPTSPQKKRLKSVSAIASTIKQAVEPSQKGLLRFFKKCTPEEKAAQIQRETERHRQDIEAQAESEELKRSERIDKERQDARELPNNWEDICERAFFRMANAVWHEDIPSELIVNSDQTQVVFAQGSKLTWAKTGASQVSLVGHDEKRAFTVVVSLSNSRVLLPFQAIYSGKTQHSCPDPKADKYTEAVNAGFRFEPSQTSTYWSTQVTMRSLVDDIIQPYFTEQKAKLGLAPDHKCIWQIDVWSVHRSEEFRNWMQAKHSDIFLQFVPGGCTPVMQACDVGFQRVFKHSLKRSYHEDIVQEVMAKLDAGKEVKFDRQIALLRDRSVRWLWDAYMKLNRTDLVQKAFEMCRVKNWNLSYACLSSAAAHDALRGLKKTDKEFYNELRAGLEDSEISVVTGDVEVEDKEIADTMEEGFDDDSGLPCDTVIAALIHVDQPGVSAGEDEDLAAVHAVENIDAIADEFVAPAKSSSSVVEVEVEEFGPGKRKRRPNTRYQNFWRHHDDVASDIEEGN